MSLSDKIKSKWPNASSPETYILGEGGLHYWDSKLLGPQPTMEEIEAIEPVFGSVRNVPAYDFQFRFTDDELAAIQLSIDPTTIRIRTMLQTVREDIDLDSDDTQRMVGYLVTQGFLTEQRAAEVLS